MSHVEITVTVRAVGHGRAVVDESRFREVVQTMGGSVLVPELDTPTLDVEARFCLPSGVAHPAHVLQFVDLAHTIAQEALEP